MLRGVVGRRTSLGPDEPERDGADLLAALLDGMDAALCAFDADGVVTHWNREAERILGWTAAEAVGRHGFMRLGRADRGRRGGREPAAVGDAGPGAAGPRVRAAHQGGRPSARTDPVGRRAGSRREAYRGVLRLQRGTRADRSGAVDRPERGVVRRRLLGCRPRRRRPAARRGQRTRRAGARHGTYGRTGPSPGRVDRAGRGGAGERAHARSRGGCAMRRPPRCG